MNEEEILRRARETASQMERAEVNAWARRAADLWMQYVLFVRAGFSPEQAFQLLLHDMRGEGAAVPTGEA